MTEPGEALAEVLAALEKLVIMHLTQSCRMQYKMQWANNVGL